MDVEETVKKITSMEIRGAGRIARSAAEALKDFAINYQGTDADTFKIQLECAAATLINTRPTAVSLSNAVNFTVKNITDISEVEALRTKITENADDFVKWSNSAVAKISEHALEIIPDEAIVMTHCNSSAVVSSLIHAHEAGKNLKVFARETRPVYQGRITARELSEAGILVTLIIDSAARYYMDKIDIVMVGADTVEASGNVINKIGTCGLAIIASEFKVPFHVCAETYKFSPRSLSGEKTVIEERAVEEIISPDEIPGLKVFNPVFDVTPARFIKSIICEKGIISVSEVEDIIKNIFE
jgi:ribose 1,5-bisphosphate isomerase